MHPWPVWARLDSASHCSESKWGKCSESRCWPAPLKGLQPDQDSTLKAALRPCGGGLHKRVHVHVRPARSIFSNLPIVAEPVTQFYVRPAPSNLCKALNFCRSAIAALVRSPSSSGGGFGRRGKRRNLYRWTKSLAEEGQSARNRYTLTLWLSREGYANITTASLAPCSNQSAGGDKADRSAPSAQAEGAPACSVE